MALNPDEASPLFGSVRSRWSGHQVLHGHPVTDRDRAAVVVVSIAVGYGLLAVLLPHPYPSFDEAKYLAIGQNALDGRGPLTAFGARFLVHAPLWPMVFAAPDVALHLDPWLWGYVLNAISGAVVLLLAARVAWRFGPLPAVLTTAALAGWIGMFQLARTARLDVPEAALALAYLAVAMSAVDSGLARRGILAGLLFSFAFLTKEASLALLVAPFVGSIALRRPIGRVARAAGLVLIVIVPMVSWWFAWFAQATGRVFALGLGRPLLLPLGATILSVGAALVLIGTGGGPFAKLRGAIDQRLANRRLALTLAGLLMVSWVGILLVAFSRSDVLAGRALLDIGQLVRWAREWGSDLAPMLLVGIGSVVSIVAAIRRDDRPIEPLVACLVSVPWLLLVAVLGEPPRNDIAQVALLAAIGAGGWLQATAWLRGRDRATMLTSGAITAFIGLAADALLARAGVASRLTKSALGLLGSTVAGAVVGALLALPGWRPRLAQIVDRPSALVRLLADGRALGVALAVLLSLGSLAAVSARVAVGSSNPSRSVIASAVARWLETNLPPGSTVMFGSVQANETALVLDGRYRLRLLEATVGVTSETAPLGIAVRGVPSPDIVVMDPHPREHGWLVFTASMIRSSLAAARPVAIVYVTGIDTATPSMIDWLANAPGISLASTISAPQGGTPLVARIYRVDMRSLQVPDNRTYASTSAILRLADDLNGSVGAPTVAAALLQRLVVTDQSPSSEAAIARLRAMAAP